MGRRVRATTSARAAKRITRVVRCASCMQVLFRDGKPHNNAEVARRTGENVRIITEARGWLRERGVYLFPSTVLGEGWWEATTDATKVSTHNARRARNHYTETRRLAQATAGALAANPHDANLALALTLQQSTAMTLGVRIGLTPTQIADDLTVVVT